jgi:hypothetical protein
MDDNRWEDLKLELNRKFKVEEERFEDLIMQTQDGPVKQGQAEVLIFETPMGKIKLVRESKPIVLDKKEHYSHQQGKTARIEYKFSDSEFSHKMKAYKWSDDEDDWVEMNAEAFSK